MPQTIKTEDPTFLETLLILYNGRICEVHCVLIHGNDSLWDWQECYHSTHNTAEVMPAPPIAVLQQIWSAGEFWTTSHFATD